MVDQTYSKLLNRFIILFQHIPFNYHPTSALFTLSWHGLVQTSHPITFLHLRCVWCRFLIDCLKIAWSLISTNSRQSKSCFLKIIFDLKITIQRSTILKRDTDIHRYRSRYVRYLCWPSKGAICKIFVAKLGWYVIYDLPNNWLSSILRNQTKFYWANRNVYELICEPQSYF